MVNAVLLVVVLLFVGGAVLLGRLSSRISSLEGSMRNKVTPTSIVADDVLVFHHPGALSEKTLQHMTDSLSKQFSGSKCVVLAEGMSLSVLTQHKIWWPLPRYDTGGCG